MFRFSLPYGFLPVTAALATAFVIGCGVDSSQDPQRALTTEVSAISKIDNGPNRTGLSISPESKAYLKTTRVRRMSFPMVTTLRSLRLRSLARRCLPFRA